MPLMILKDKRVKVSGRSCYLPLGVLKWIIFTVDVVICAMLGSYLSQTEWQNIQYLQYYQTPAHWTAMFAIALVFALTHLIGIVILFFDVPTVFKRRKCYRITETMHAAVGLLGHLACLALGCIRSYQVFHQHGNLSQMCAVPPWYMTDRCFFRDRLAGATALFGIGVLLHLAVMIVAGCRLKTTF